MVIKLKFKSDNNKKYEVKEISNSVVYTKSLIPAIYQDFIICSF